MTNGFPTEITNKSLHLEKIIHNLHRGATYNFSVQVNRVGARASVPKQVVLGL